VPTLEGTTNERDEKNHRMQQKIKHVGAGHTLQLSNRLRWNERTSRSFEYEKEGGETSKGRDGHMNFWKTKWERTVEGHIPPGRRSIYESEHRGGKRMLRGVRPITSERVAGEGKEGVSALEGGISFSPPGGRFCSRTRSQSKRINMKRRNGTGTVHQPEIRRKGDFKLTNKNNSV